MSKITKLGRLGRMFQGFGYHKTIAREMDKMVQAEVNEVTGGIGIIGPDGAQVAGNAAPYAFTTRALAQTDNGMNLVCATAQTATVNDGLPTGFGCSFEGEVSFTAGAGVTITDVRTTGATDIFCGLMQVGANTYKVRGGKA